MSRRRLSGTVEVVEMSAIVPTTSRKGLRVARVRENGIEVAELRAVNLDPAWQPSPGDHRTTIRVPALGRVIAALQALNAKIGGGE